MPSHFRLQLENWIKEIDVTCKSVLDCGGAQKPIKGRTKSWDVEDYKILDLEQPHEGSKPNLNFDLNGDWFMAEHPECYSDAQRFDVAFCLEVMEYLYKPLQALKNIWGILKPDGILYISFPFLYPIHKPSGLDYLRYTKYGAMKLLGEAGFEILENTPRTPKVAGPLFDFWKANGYKPDTTNGMHSIIETGCLIKAKKI